MIEYYEMERISIKWKWHIMYIEFTVTDFCVYVLVILFLILLKHIFSFVCLWYWGFNPGLPYNWAETPWLLNIWDRLLLPCPSRLSISSPASQVAEIKGVHYHTCLAKHVFVDIKDKVILLIIMHAIHSVYFPPYFWTL